MYFTNHEHKLNYKKLILQFRAQSDPEYKVACYIVALPEIYHHINGNTGPFPFSWTAPPEEEDTSNEWVFTETFSSLPTSYKTMILVAMNLYNPELNSFNLCTALTIWNSELYNVFLQAVDIRRGAV
jgi:hypothetical protein